MAEKFTLKKGDHKVTTTVPAEAHQLRAFGYKDEKPVKSEPKSDKK